MPLVPNPRAVVTGAAGGLGSALCRELAGRGARVLAADIDADSLRSLVDSLGSASVHAVACDVAKLGDVERLAAEAERLFGGVDLVVNNAGVAVSGPIGGIPIDSWEWIVGINFWGVVYGCHVFTPRLRAQRSGHILNVASTAGLISSPQLAPYNATKSAVVALSETLHAELAGSGVGVSVLCPTFFRTNIAASARNHGEPAMIEPVKRLMAAAKIQADGVARLALDGVARDDLYILPHRDGRILWRAKRWWPGGFHRLTPKLMGLVGRSRGGAKA